VKPLEIEHKQIVHVGIQLAKPQDTLEGTTYAHGLAEKKSEWHGSHCVATWSGARSTSTVDGRNGHLA